MHSRATATRASAQNPVRNLRADGVLAHQLDALIHVAPRHAAKLRETAETLRQAERAFLANPPRISFAELDTVWQTAMRVYRETRAGLPRGAQ